MKSVVARVLFIAALFAANVLHAQETAAIPSSPANLSSLESYSDAQLGQVLNELAAMPLIWPTNLPNNGVGGTYWSLAHPDWPPLPSMSGAPAWEISSNFLLLDDIDYPETASANNNIRAMGMLSPMDSGGGGFSPSFSFLTNGLLWLQITNVAGGTVYANLNNATDQVYSIWGTTNLTMPFANWQVETEVWPTDTNTMPFTVPMNGRNSLFLSAMDWTGITANGNQTPSWWFWLYFDTTDLSDTNLDPSGNTLLFDYTNGINPTNSPTLSIIWPQNGTPISGSNFTLQAQAGGPSVTVMASIVDTNGDTNIVQGLVEQSGAVWVKNLPLAAGTNILTVTVTDTMGNQTTTNLTVTQSSVTVTMNPLTSDQLNQQLVNVGGTVSDLTSSVFVNGIEATNNDGTWGATNVPVSPTDMAVLNIQVYTGDPVLETSQNNAQPQPPMVVLSSFTNLAYLYVSNEDDQGPFECLEADSWTWNNGGPFYVALGFYDIPFDGFQSWTSVPPDGPGYTPSLWWFDVFTNQLYLNPVWEQSAITYSDGNNFEQRTNQTQVMLVPGGGQQAGTVTTCLILAHASEFSVPPLINSNIDPDIWEYLFCYYPPSWYAANVPLPPEWLQINGQQLANTGVTNDDGSVWGAMTTNVVAGNPLDVTVNATEVHSNNDYTFDEKAYQLVSQCVATTPVNQARTNIGVGEQVNLFFNPALPANFTNIIWSTTAGSLSVTNGADTLFTAPNRATNATITATVANVSLSIPFNVIEPTNLYYSIFEFIHVYDEADIGFYAWLYIQPDTVNFGNVQIQEEQAYLVANGVYSQYNGEGHQATNPTPFGITVVPGRGTGGIGLASDECYSGQTDPALNIPYANGTETLIVPLDFRVGESDPWRTNFATLTWHCSKSDGGDHGDGLLNASKSNASLEMNVNDPSVGSP